MKYLVFILFALSLIGCKGKYIETSRGEPYTQVVEETCEKCGICRYYDYNKGKYRTGASCRCEGRTKVKYEITPVLGYYEKEPNKEVPVDKKVRLHTGDCK